MRLLIYTATVMVHLLLSKTGLAQISADSTLRHNEAVSYAKDVKERMVSLDQEFTKEFRKHERKLKDQEKKLVSLLSRSDSGLVKLLENTKARKLLDDGRSYIPMLDSLSTSLNFLFSRGIMEKMEMGEAGNAIKDVQSSLQNAELFHAQMQDRLQFMKDRLLQLGKFKELRKMQEKLFYYKQQAEELRQALNQPDKLIAKTMVLLQQTAFFRDFFAKNSQLASMFMLPGSTSLNNPSILNGLQTVSGIQSLLQQRLGLSGTALQSQIQAPSPSVQQLADQMKERLGIKNGSEPMEDMPNFKPSPLKNRPVWQRIEFGSNIQAQRSGVFPATLDLAMTAEYKAGKRNSIGIGAAYKLGLGEVFKDIRFSHQGLGIRSFIDFQWKGNLFLSGGFEINYRHEISSMDALKDRSAWQESGLIGLSRKFKAGARLTGKVQLLWDFLSYQQIPRSQAFIFRFGYNFNK